MVERSDYIIAIIIISILLLSACLIARSTKLENRQLKQQIDAIQKKQLTQGDINRIKELCEASKY